MLNIEALHNRDIKITEIQVENKLKILKWSYNNKKDSLNESESVTMNISFHISITNY